MALWLPVMNYTFQPTQYQNPGPCDFAPACQLLPVRHVPSVCRATQLKQSLFFIDGEEITMTLRTKLSPLNGGVNSFSSCWFLYFARSFHVSLSSLSWRPKHVSCGLSANNLNHQCTSIKSIVDDMDLGILTIPAVSTLLGKGRTLLVWVPGGRGDEGLFEWKLPAVCCWSFGFSRNCRGETTVDWTPRLWEYSEEVARNQQSLQIVNSHDWRNHSNAQGLMHTPSTFIRKVGKILREVLVRLEVPDLQYIPGIVVWVYPNLSGLLQAFVVGVLQKPKRSFHKTWWVMCLSPRLGRKG